jgi:chromosome segregation ATPase
MAKGKSIYIEVADDFMEVFGNLQKSITTIESKVNSFDSKINTLKDSQIDWDYLRDTIHEVLEPYDKKMKHALSETEKLQKELSFWRTSTNHDLQTLITQVLHDKSIKYKYHQDNLNATRIMLEKFDKMLQDLYLDAEIKTYDKNLSAPDERTEEKNSQTHISGQP